MLLLRQMVLHHLTRILHPLNDVGAVLTGEGLYLSDRLIAGLLPSFGVIKQLCKPIHHILPGISMKISLI